MADILKKYSVFLPTNKLLTLNFKHQILSSGFTLLELMVVIALIAIMTGFSVPAIRTSFFSDQLKSTARKLTGLITETSQQAVRDQTAYLLTFDFTGKKVKVQKAGQHSLDDEDKKKSELQLPKSIRILDVTTSHGGKKSMGEAELYFSPKGYVDKTYVHLQDDNDRDLTLQLSPFLGVIQVTDSYVELE